MENLIMLAGCTIVALLITFSVIFVFNTIKRLLHNSIFNNNGGAVAIVIMIVGMSIWMAAFIVHHASKDKDINRNPKTAQVCQPVREADPNEAAK